LPFEVLSVMSFVNPLFFLAMLAAAVPVLLHLIKRERARKIEFPTLMFLRRVSRKTIRHQRLRHLLLLLLRVMALCFVVLAFTRPYRMLAPAAASRGPEAADHIILLDNSLSMGYGGRWAEARKAAEGVIRGLHDGDRVALLLFSDRTTVLFPLTGDLAAIRAAGVGAAELTDRPTRYAQALKTAERLALDALGGRCILHLISDFQKTGVAAEEKEFRLGSGFKLDCVDVGADDYSNITFGEVLVSEAAEGSPGGGSLKLRFPIINFGSRERMNTRISLSMDGRPILEAKADLGKGDVQELGFQLPGPTAGPHEIVLEVDDPALVRDNRYALSLETQGRSQVLAVEDSGSATVGRDRSYFLSRALNISALSRYQLTVAPLERVESGGAVSNAIVIWNDASGGSAVLQKRLQDFVQQGGGLVVVVSDDARAADFNRSFGSWLPLKIGVSADRERRSVGARSDYLLLTDLRWDHPIFRPFSAPHSGNFTGARFYRCARLSLNGPAEVLAHFDNGLPALVCIERGKGRVLIYASSADDSANDLPLKAVYAPLWQQMLRFLDRAGEEKRAVQVGDAINPRTILLGSALARGKTGMDSNQAIVVLDPDKKRVQLPVGGNTVMVEKTGFYEIRSSDLNTSVAVNPVPRESDLAHGNAEEMSAAWAAPDPKAGPETAGDEQVSSEEQDKRQRIWRYLLAAAIIFFVGEGLLSNRFVLKPD
jgi:hypothetical protein